MAALRNAKLDVVVVFAGIVASLVLMSVLGAQDEWQYHTICQPAWVDGESADTGGCTLDPGPDPWCRSTDYEDPCGTNTSTPHGGYCYGNLRRQGDGCVELELDLVITHTYPADCQPMGDEDCDCVVGTPYGATDHFVSQCTEGL